MAPRCVTARLLSLIVQVSRADRRDASLLSERRREQRAQASGLAERRHLTLTVTGPRSAEPVHRNSADSRMLGQCWGHMIALSGAELSVQAADMSIAIRALPTTTIRALRPRILKAIAAGVVLPSDWRIAVDAAGADSLDDRHTLDRCGVRDGDELFVVSCVRLG